jgi:hypothetical protein
MNRRPSRVRRAPASLPRPGVRSNSWNPAADSSSRMYPQAARYDMPICSTALLIEPSSSINSNNRALPLPNFVRSLKHTQTLILGSMIFSVAHLAVFPSERLRCAILPGQRPLDESNRDVVSTPQPSGEVTVRGSAESANRLRHSHQGPQRLGKVAKISAAHERRRHWRGTMRRQHRRPRPAQ